MHDARAKQALLLARHSRPSSFKAVGGRALLWVLITVFGIGTALYLLWSLL